MLNEQVTAVRQQRFWNDLSLSELVLNNRFVPILQEEMLSEYSVRKVSFASLVEFRSKMGFKFRSVEY